MPAPHRPLQDTPEALLIGLAQNGGRDAYGELVSRRQSWIRNLMRRLSGDVILADDLAQEVFLQAFQKLHQLRAVEGFGAWLKRLAVNVWLQHLRKNDALRGADEFDETIRVNEIEPGMTLDLDDALATLPPQVRICIVLAYHAGLTQAEISQYTAIPLGTVKSHTRRGTKRLQDFLSAYRNSPAMMEVP